jgi:hypothetical protein
MASEPETPGGLREEWMAVLFVALVLLAAVGIAVAAMLGL